MKRFSILTIFLMFATISLVAQTGDWRRYRHELVFGAGTAEFMGDLGGGKDVGTHFVKDFDIQAGRWAFMLGYGYKLTDRFALRTAIYYGRVFGNDEFTPEPARNGRNLSFRSPIIELSEVVEFSIIREKFGYRYNSKHARKLKATPNLYIFAGVGGFYFNPRAQYLPTDANGNPDESNPDYGKWYSLQPLGTEGQGIVSTRQKYSRIQMSIPFGVGLNCMLTKSWGIGFDFGFRYTLTDYIDDVSSTYVDPDIFDDPMASYFSNPACKYNVGAGEQRGDSNWNDAYMFLTIKVTYKLFSSRRGRSKF
ncbi:MAG: outer membrane beta-barrel protein [Bacteroidales bacterium]|nr:outer membrane beta-barrel protein [Bacteroidales bacterium]